METVICQVSVYTCHLHPLTQSDAHLSSVNSGGSPREHCPLLWILVAGDVCVCVWWGGRSHAPQQSAWKPCLDIDVPQRDFSAGGLAARWPLFFPLTSISLSGFSPLTLRFLLGGSFKCLSLLLRREFQFHTSNLPLNLNPWTYHSCSAELCNLLFRRAASGHLSYWLVLLYLNFNSRRFLIDFSQRGFWFHKSALSLYIQVQNMRTGHQDIEGPEKVMKRRWGWCWTLTQK